MRKFIFGLFIFAAALLIPGTSTAQSPSGQDVVNPLSHFKYYHDFNQLNNIIPKVIEIPVNTGIYIPNPSFALVEVQSNHYHPYKIITKMNKTAYVVTSRLEGSTSVEERALYDGKSTTSKEFALVNTNMTSVTLRLEYASPITSGDLNLDIDPNGKLPTRISLRADGYTAIADKPFYQSDLQFPTYTAQNWEVTLTYSQPLRINEISLTEESNEKTQAQYMRFLMRPDFSYRLYSEADGYVDLPHLESGDLEAVTDVVSLPLPSAIPNPLFVPADDDKDSVPNSSDNCEYISNRDQLDKDNNGKGDACEDFDNDGELNYVDNCPDRPNRDQQDSDGDGKGDHCDAEESRLTERLGFLPWLGIGLGFGIVIFLFAATVKKAN